MYKTKYQSQRYLRNRSSINTFRLLRRLQKARRISNRSNIRRKQKYASKILYMPQKTYPTKAFKKFTWNYGDIQVPVGGGKVLQWWTANDLYVPQGDYPTVQPLMYNQMKELYTNYLVVACKITIKIAISASDLAAIPSRVWRLHWCPSTQLASDANWSRIYEKASSIVKISPDSNRGSGTLTFKKYVKTSQVFNSPLKDKENEFGATFDAHPSKLWLWILEGHRWGNYTDGDFTGVFVNVKMDMYTRLWERKQPTAS